MVIHESDILANLPEVTGLNTLRLKYTKRALKVYY